MKKLITFSAFSALFASTLLGADNYLITNAISGSKFGSYWSLGTRTTTDDLYFDASKYFELNPAESSWTIQCNIFQQYADKNYSTAKSFNIQNLYKDNGDGTNTPKTVRFTTPNEGSATSKYGLIITGDLNYITGTQEQKFIFLSRNATNSRMYVSIGGDVNVGSADTKASNKGYLAFGGYENGTTVEKVAIGGNVNIYGSAELQLSVGSLSNTITTASSDLQAKGSLNMYSADGKNPTLVVNALSTDNLGTKQGLNSTIDFAGINGVGTIKTAGGAGDFTSHTYLLTRIAESKTAEFSGTIIDGKNAQKSVISIGMYGKGKQILRGEIDILGEIRAGRGELHANVKNAGVLYLGHAGDAARFGAIGLDSEFGTVNLTGLVLQTSRSTLLYDIDGTNQDFIAVNGTLDLNDKQYFYIEFTSLANIEQDAEYKLLSYETLAKGNEDVFQATFAEGFDGELFLKDNALWVKFTTVLPSAVPEPAEWAMILGGIALGLAVYRKRK